MSFRRVVQGTNALRPVFTICTSSSIDPVGQVCVIQRVIYCRHHRVKGAIWPLSKPDLDVHIVNNNFLRLEETDAAPRKGTQSLHRALALLREVTASSRGGLSVAEMAARARIDRTTAHRMARSLAAEGLFDYSSETRRYFLGPLAYEIGLAAGERADLPKLCAAPMKRIAEQTGDTVFLMLRSDCDAVCVARTEGHYPVKTFVVDVAYTTSTRRRRRQPGNLQRTAAR